MDIANTQRAALVELLHASGPQAPTLCDGWTAYDLAAHLYVRENDPLAAIGIVFGPLSKKTERTMTSLKQTIDFDELVDKFNEGPSWYSPFRIAKINELGNTFEYFVHYEDLHRAAQTVAPRLLPDELDQWLWTNLKTLAKHQLKKAKLGIVLQRTRDGHPTGQAEVVALGPDPVTISGQPAELTMWLFGRTNHADVKIEGPERAVNTVRGLRLSL